MYTERIKLNAKQSLATAASHSFGTFMKPNVKRIGQFKPTRGYIAPEIEPWVLTKELFEDKLREEYMTVKPGGTKMLVAATGIGKTTKLPLRLVGLSNKSGIVLVPDDWAATNVYQYVKGQVKNGNLPNCSVEYLSSYFVDNPKVEPTVYYTSDKEFLPRLHNDVSFVKRMNIDFVYLDEAHVDSPLYDVIDILCSAKILPDTKVFFGTATHHLISRVLKGTDNYCEPLAQPSALFSLDSPQSCLDNSPLNFKRLRARTLIFLPSDKYLDMWEQYYDQFDVKVMKVYSYSSSKIADDVKNLLSCSELCVVLTSGRMEFGVTFDFDDVICCGYKEHLVVDYSNGSVDLQVRTVTLAERKQRCGRVGRHMSGRAYFNDVKVSIAQPRLSPDKAIYTWMWCKLFRIELKNPAISMFDDLYPNATDEFLAMLACSRVHPILIAPYLDDNGFLYQGWDVLTHVFRCKDKVLISADDNEDNMVKWPVKNSGPRDWLEEPVEYRCRVTFPDQLVSIPVIAYLLYCKSLKGMSLELDDASVVSALVVDRPKPFVRLPSIVAKSHTAKKPQRSGSVMTAVRNSMVDLHQVDEFDSLQFIPPAVPKVPDEYLTRKAVSPVTASVANWVQSVPDEPIRQSRRRSHQNSESSDEPHDVELISVDPRRYKYNKLFPMGTAARRIFEERESADALDYSRFSSLLYVKKQFGSLHPTKDINIDKQNSYFVSVIRVHNNELMNKYQQDARTSVKAKFFFKSRVDYDQGIDESAKLLYSCRLESYFVGIDKRTKHGRSTPSSPMSTSFNRYANNGQFYIMASSQAVRDAFECAKLSVIAITENDLIKGTAWQFDKTIVMPNHISQYYNSEAIYQDVEKDVIMFAGKQFSDHLQIRGPVNGETVYACGYHPIRRTFEILGPFGIAMENEYWTLSTELIQGCSGFAIVSQDSTEFLGMYLGRSPVSIALNNEFDPKGHFVSVDSFMLELAKFTT